MIELRKHNEKLVVEILLNDGSGDGGANAAAASVADSQDVDGVLHGKESDGGEKGRSGGLQVFFAPPDNGGNNLVTQGLPQGCGHAVVAAHADAAIFALMEGCHGGEHQYIARLSFANEAGNHGDELVLNEGGGHGKKEVVKLAPR